MCGELGLVDVTLNLLLFAPFGVALAWLGATRRRALLVGATASLVIELLQLTVVTGRDPSLSDLLTNAAGSWLGAALTAWWPGLVRPDAARARRLAAIALGAWLATQGLVTWLLQPWAPGPPHAAELAPRYPHAPAFGGEVLTAQLGAYGLPPAGPLALGEPLRDLVARGDPLQATIVAGPPVDGAAVVAVITDRRRHGVTRLSQRERALVYGAPTRSAQFRLRRPFVAVPDAFPDEARGDTLVVAGALHDGVVRAWVGSREGTMAVAHALSPSLGWFLVAPPTLPLGPGDRLPTALWLAAALAPVAYWGARGRGGRLTAGWAATLLVTIVAGLAVVPALAGWPPVAWTEWLGAATGLAAGGAAARAAVARAGPAALA